jgi:hypothetical protein
MSCAGSSIQAPADPGKKSLGLLRILAGSRTDDITDLFSLIIEAVASDHELRGVAGPYGVNKARYSRLAHYVNTMAKDIYIQVVCLHTYNFLITYDT